MKQIGRHLQNRRKTDIINFYHSIEEGYRQKMAEISIFSSISAKKFLERYMKVLGEEEEYVESEHEYEYEDVVFYDLCDGYSVMESQDEEYSKEVICELAQKDTMIYTYLNEDFLEGTILVFEEGRIVREFVECYSVPRLNHNTGELLDYEKERKKMASWIDVGQYVEYMFEKYKK